MNAVNFVGRLTRDPEEVETKNGGPICKLRMAITRKGEEGGVYTNVKVFGKQAGPCAKYLSKGRQAAVSGRLELDEWQSDDGNTRSRLYVVAERVDFLGGDGERGGGGGGGGGGGRSRSGGGDPYD